MDRKAIKNRTKQIWEEVVSISSKFPRIENMTHNRYAKCWLATIFIDICGYTEFCKNSKNNPIKIGKTLRAFHEGIIDILQYHGIKNIDIQGDGIFGVIICETENSPHARQIFNAAVEINSFLTFCWNKLKYKISISLEEEIIIVVGGDKNRKLVYAGGSVNVAKKIMENSNLRNCIIIHDFFIENNEEILFNKKLNSYKYEYDEEECIHYSEMYHDGWE